MYEKDDMRSPFMAAIEHNQLQVIQMLLAKTFQCPSNPKLI